MARHEFTLDQHEQMFGFWTEARATYDEAEDRENNFEVLKTVPGIDPVLAVVDGHPENIPKSGWLIDSTIAPGYGGVIRVYKYPKGALVPRDISDSREHYHSARVHFFLKQFGGYTIAYENQAFPHKDIEPYARMQPESYTGLSFADTSVVELENGGRILDQKAPLEIRGGSQFFALDWRDIDSRSELLRSIDINRVTDDAETVRKILAQLGYSMGMTEDGAKTLIETSIQKIGLAA